jgi:hypothetical protein
MNKDQPQRPLVHLFVGMPMLFVGFVCIGVTLLSVYSSFANIRRAEIPELNKTLIMIPAFFLWLPISFLLSNLLIYHITPLRRATERYVKKAGRPGYAQSQKGLLKALLIVAAICIPLIVLGFLV